MGGHVVGRQRSRFRYGKVLGQRLGMRLLDADLLGEGAVSRRRRRHDTCADRDARPRPLLDDPPDQLAAGRRRQRQRDLVLPAHEEQVGKHDPGRLGGDDQLLLGRSRRRDVLHLEDVARVAGAVEHPRLHLIWAWQIVNPRSSSRRMSRHRVCTTATSSSSRQRTRWATCVEPNSEMI